MGGYLIQFIFFGIPIIAILLFVASLYEYFEAKKKYKIEVTEANEKEVKSKKKFVILSSVIMGVIVTVVMVLLCLVYMSIAYM